VGWLQDLLKEIPLSSILRERVVIAEEKYETAVKSIESYKQRIASLEHENEKLRAQIPSQSESGLSGETKSVLVLIFKSPTLEHRDIGAMARALKMELGILQYHLDRLREAGLAEITGGNYLDGHVYWGLTTEGRRFVVESKLV
jgi:DNA-binding transcriptional ArsR family regulator